MSLILLSLYIFSIFLALGSGVAAAFSDIRGMKIPNRYPLIVVLSFFLAYFCHHFAGADVFFGIKAHLLSFFVVFFVTFTLFQFGIFGGGDSKLLTAYALWVAYAGLAPLLVFMSLVGAVMGVLAIVVRKRKFFKSPREGSWIFQLQEGDGGIPYGVAIVIGAFVSFGQVGYLSVQGWTGFFG